MFLKKRKVFDVEGERKLNQLKREGRKVEKTRVVSLSTFLPSLFDSKRYLNAFSFFAKNGIQLCSREPENSRRNTKNVGLKGFCRNLRLASSGV